MAGSSSALRRETTGRPGSAGDEATLFERHNGALLRAVGRSVSGSREVVDDACQRAWLTLLRSQPERTATLFGWLYTVALREAYRIAREERACCRLEDLPQHERERALGVSAGVDEALEARAALEALASLPPRQRHDMTLRAAGYTYAEIADIGGEGRSLNNVNKHLTKARLRLRRIAGPPD